MLYRNVIDSHLITVGCNQCKLAYTHIYSIVYCILSIVRPQCQCF